MPIRDPRQLTKRETVKRLQAAKEYLYNKDRIAYMRTNVVCTPNNYNPECDSSYYAAPKLSAIDMRRLADDTLSLVDYGWPDDARFKRTNAAQFVGWCFGSGAVIGETVQLVFYVWKRLDCTAISSLTATKFATLWLGTWHHAPILAWTAKDLNVKVNSLPKYSDLIK